MRVQFSQLTLDENEHYTTFYVDMILLIYSSETNSDCLKMELDNSLFNVGRTAQLELLLRECKQT